MALLIRAAAAALLAAAAAGCLRDPDPILYTEPTVALHAMLQAGDEEASVLLTRFLPRNTVPHAVSGAVVYVGTAGDSVAMLPAGLDAPACRWDFAENAVAARQGCYHARLPRAVLPGATWWIRVHYPTGEVARGTVRVPLSPQLTEPAADVRVTLAHTGQPAPGTPFRPAATVPLAWSGADTAARVELTLRYAAVTGYRNGEPIAGTSCYLHAHFETENPDSGHAGRLQVLGAGCHGPTGAMAWDSIRVPIMVVATDTAAARYMHDAQGSRGIRPDRARAGVEGALGVFGAVSAAQRVLTFLPPP